MIQKCVSGKRSFASRSIAEDVLVQLWSANDYAEGQGPLSVYQCDECGQFHLTSKGPMNPVLTDAIASGKIKLRREANKWLNKLK